jgi:transposase
MAGSPKPVRPDAKVQALKERDALNPEPVRVTDERFLTQEFFDPRDVVQVKYEMVRRVQAEGATVTDAADAFGFSRPTFYQAQRALEEEGLPGLLRKRSGPKGAHKLSEDVMVWIEGWRGQHPAVGSEELSRRVREHFGLSVHPRSIERALVRRKKKRRSSR